MVVFDYVEYSNFLSTGSSGNRIELNSRNKTLIVGTNGSGKSTILDAITFGLFGKAFRSINKGQLVNSINGKKCVVEIQFHIGNISYKIIRGIKPNIFEIYIDEVLIDQTAETKDYQSYLELNILGMNFKTFTQVVILGSTSYIPFMKLSAGSRREVIDEILDIKIFTLMSKILKDKITETKESIIETDNKLSIIKSQTESQQKLIQSMSGSKDLLIANLNQKINNSQLEIEINQNKVGKLLTDTQELQTKITLINEIPEKIQNGKISISKKKSKIIDWNSDIEFFTNHDNCNVCKQEIQYTHKESIISELTSNVLTNQNSIDTMDIVVNKLSDKLSVMVGINKDISSKNIELSSLNSSIAMLNKNIQLYQNEILSESKENNNIESEKLILSELAKQGLSTNKTKSELLSVKSIQDMSTQLLKDTGIKTQVIKEYLPVINQLINKHLSAMDFFVKFELDENFEEVIKSRHRDEFSYSSFSEGEKFRIDMSIMFCWREIARLKNSLNTNILFFDEVLDGVLDLDGVDFFLGFIDSLSSDTNCFIISHKTDQISDRFDTVLKFTKNKDFSEMEIV